MQTPLPLYILAWALASAAPAALAAPPSERVFPSTTCGWISTAGLAEVNQAFTASSLGRLGADPALGPFLDSVRRAKASPLDGLEHASGLRWQELIEVAAGEAAGAVVEYPGEDAGLALYVAVDRASPAVDRVLADARRRLLAEGAQPTTIDGADAQAYRRPSGELVIYVLGPDYLISANHAGLAATLSQRAAAAAPAGGLGEEASFTESGLMAARQQPNASPSMRFYVDLVTMLEVLDDRDAIDDEAGKLTPREEAAKHGYDAIRGLSGWVEWNGSGVDLSYRLGVLLQTPLRSSMKMVRLFDAELPQPPDWIPADSISFLTTYWDLTQIVPNLGVLFDEVAGDGIEGTFNDILVDLQADDGPGVDLQGDLFEHLGPRVHVVKQQLLPVGPKSDCDSLLVQVDDEEAVAEAVEALVVGDPTVRRVPFPGRPHALWRVGVPQRADLQAVRFTTTGLTVANGHLVVATNFDVVRTLLGSSGQATRLADADDIRAATEWLLENVGEQGCLRVVSRLYLDLHVTYELARQDKLDDAESIYASVARLAAQESEQSAGGPDYALLPDYSLVAPYLGVDCLQGRLHPSGWVFEGALLAPDAGPSK
ncbi:hypothetical protein Pla175_13720 [Pirellulimonas nuda]|uniref:DUF3352 domain-containing protein n=1 Tax=Pirellulimonas nuda TaxID=2528009 RepID=A0A518D949_9BACT|nr:hypothetical protein [Pirellulimonas nuda]QDU88003.1 hypothetical protein Pla175_13720 [Pirellulimonas nuda]